MTDFAHDLEMRTRADIEANGVAEYLGAYNFGRSVQRVEDHQAAEAARGATALAHMFCAFAGSMVTFIVCALLAHTAATIGHLVYGFFGLVFGYAICCVVYGLRSGSKVW
jgi:hypothetical protein